MPGLSRGLALLQLFPRSKPAKTLAELAAGLGLSRSATYRLVYTLEADGFIARDAETRRYRLTSKTLDLGFEYLHAQPITEIRAAVSSHVERSQQCGGACRDPRRLALRLPRARAAQCRTRQQSATRRTAAGAYHVERPRHARASGRNAAARDLRRAAQGDARHARPPCRSPNSTRQIAADRKRGYVFHKSTVDPGLVSLAFPIRDHDSQVVAAVTVIVPEKLSDTIGGEKALRPMVHETADAISRKRSGYRG